MSLLLLWVLACGGQEAEIPKSASLQESTVSGVAGVASPEGSAASQKAPLPAITLPARNAKTPYPVVADKEMESALRALKRLVTQETADPENPWAIAHGLLALGESLQLSNGQNAVDGLFEGYAKTVQTEGHALIAFPQRATGEQGQTIRVEPHTDLIMKALAEIGVRLDRPVQVEGTTHQVGELYYDTILSTFLDKGTGLSSFANPNDMPWGLQAVATYADHDLTWEVKGHSQDLNMLTEFLVHVLTVESKNLFQAMGQGDSFVKDGKGIFGYTCGGSHLLQGAAYLVGKGFGAQVEKEKIEAQIALSFWRFPRELALYEKLRNQSPENELVLTVQQLKFVGHWIESLNKMAAMKLFDPTPAQQAAMGEAVKILVETAKRLKKTGAMDNLAVLREGNEQLYLDIVGDASHAVRGMELALGRATIAY
jgi:hypothetical protein